MQTCRQCRRHKHVEEFSFRDQARGKRHNICTVCFGEYRRQHYRDNKSQYFKRNHRNTRIRAKILRRWLFDYLAQHPCVDCGEPDPVVLEFDHVDRATKVMDVSVMAQRGYPLATLKAEVEKCVVRCANDHRRRTVAQLGWPRGRLKAEAQPLDFKTGTGVQEPLQDQLDTSPVAK